MDLSIQTGRTRHAAQAAAAPMPPGTLPPSSATSRKPTLRPGSLDALQVSQELARLRALPSLADVRRVLDGANLSRDVALDGDASVSQAALRVTRPLPARPTGPLAVPVSAPVLERILLEAVHQPRGPQRPAPALTRDEAMAWLEDLTGRPDVRERWARLDMPLQVATPVDVEVDGQQVRVLYHGGGTTPSSLVLAEGLEPVAKLIDLIAAGTRGPQVLWFDDQTRRGRMPVGSSAWDEAVTIARAITWDLPLQHASDPAVTNAGVPSRLDHPQAMSRYVSCQRERLMTLVPRLDADIDGESRIGSLRELVALMTLLETALSGGGAVTLRDVGPRAVYSLMASSSPLAEPGPAAVDLMEAATLSGKLQPGSMFARAVERWQASLD